MPRYRTRPCLEELLSRLIPCTSMHQMNLRIAFRSSRCWVDVKTTKVSTILQSFTDWQICKVLVSECNNFAFSNKPSKLVFSYSAEFAQLDASDFGTDGWGQFVGDDSWGEKFWVFGICV